MVGYVNGGVSMVFDVVVLAGRKNQGKLSSVSQEVWEANIDIAGKPMLHWVLEAFEPLEDIKTIVVVGPEGELKRFSSPKVRFVEPGPDLISNLKSGLDASSTEYVIVSTSDIPLITPEIVRSFIKQCLATGADFCYPCSTKEDCEQKYPGVQRTYVTLRDGTYTGGNMFFVRKAVIDCSWEMLEKMVEYRKSPVKMASLLGVGLLARLLFRLAGVREIETRVYELMGFRGAGILGAPPEIGVDVDKPSDLELCRRVLTR